MPLFSEFINEKCRKSFNLFLYLTIVHCFVRLHSLCWSITKKILNKYFEVWLMKCGRRNNAFLWHCNLKDWFTYVGTGEKSKTTGLAHLWFRRKHFFSNLTKENVVHPFFSVLQVKRRCTQTLRVSVPAASWKKKLVIALD